MSDHENYGNFQTLEGMSRTLNFVGFLAELYDGVDQASCWNMVTVGCGLLYIRRTLSPKS